MLCAKCHEREAMVHVTMVCEEARSKVDFCRECASKEMGIPAGMGREQFEEYLQSGKWTPGSAVQELAEGIWQYPLGAYEFVREGLADCLISSGRRQASAHDLLEALRRLALKKFGKEAKANLAKWKIFRTEDFGEIVFEMIDSGLLLRNPEDSREDFQNGFNFDEAFPEEL